MLARMLQRHPEIVCVSDLIEPVGPVPLLDDDRVVTADEFLQTLRAPSLPERIRYWRAQPTDELLHLPANDDDVSLLLTYTLPFLDPHRPVELLEELCAAMNERAPTTMAEHLVAVFAWLRDRFGGSRWIERTGGSLPHAQQLVETFPEGRFVHLHRDPAEVAISMQTGSFFRLYRLLEADPDLEHWDWNVIPSAAMLGEMLTRWELDADLAWRQLSAEQFLQMSYEELMADPATPLLRLVEFILERPTNACDHKWARSEASGVIPAPLRRFGLGDAQRCALEQACLPSRRLLGYV